jgi:multiple antibiotic resistance protein
MLALVAATLTTFIILFIISLEMLFDKRHQRKEEDINFTSDKLSIFPLATPLLAGPAAITSVIVSVSAMGNNFSNQAIGMLALVAATLTTFIILFLAAKSEKIINKRIISVFSRIVAIVLAGLSIQYILNGIKAFINL